VVLQQLLSEREVRGAVAVDEVARRLTREPGPNLLPSLCMGAALLVTADLVAQRLIPGHRLPVGVVTGVLGGVYLIGLLAGRRRAGRP
jgi:iron complex transport system permease protein